MRSPGLQPGRRLPPEPSWTSSLQAVRSQVCCVSRLPVTIRYSSRADVSSRRARPLHRHVPPAPFTETYTKHRACATPPYVHVRVPRTHPTLCLPPRVHSQLGHAWTEPPCRLPGLCRPHRAHGVCMPRATCKHRPPLHGAATSPVPPPPTTAVAPESRFYPLLNPALCKARPQLGWVPHK